jgi:hypothetical protein
MSSVPKPSVRGALVLALLAYFVLTRFVPFGRTLLYPLTLLATWVHEMGHGMTALVLGGSFSSLDVFANGSGLAYCATSQPWQAGLTAAGGLLAPPIAGAVLLGTSRGPRSARILLAGLGVAILLSLTIWVRSLTGWIVLPIVAAVLAAFVVWGGPRRRMVFAQLIGVTLAIDTVSGSGYLFSASVTVDGTARPSDITNVAQAFGGSYVLWGLLLGAFSFGLLALGLFLAWRSDPQTVNEPARPAPRGTKT